MALFYADAILSKKGPLARVWLAAHYERKLSKAQTLQTDIGQSAKAIESRPLALRISGQLLLGVCRIYSRKAKYLLDDCNEALVKIKLAFRPGVVDMTDEQLAVPANAITLQGDGFNLDLFGDTWDFDTTRKSGGRHLAREADINLPMQEDFLMSIDGGGDWNLDMDGGFGDLDLNFGELDTNELEEDSMAVEVARDAAPARSTRESLASALQVRTNDADLDGVSMRTREGGDFGDMDLDIGEVAADLNLDFGDFMGDGGDFGMGGNTDGSRHSSPLTELGPTTPIDAEVDDIPAKKSPKKRKIKERKQVIDSVTELNDAANRRGTHGVSFTKADVSSITTQHGYLSDSVAVMRFMEIRADPVAHFFPTKVTEAGSFYCAAPPGLAPEISDLFLFPATQGAGQKRKGPVQNDRASKRQRLESEPVDDVEQLRGRVGSVAPSVDRFEAGGDGFDGFNDESGFIPNDESMPMDNFQFEVDDSLHIDQQAASSPSRPIEEGGKAYADEDCPVAMFDTQPMTQDTSIAASSPSKRDEKEANETVNKDGYSRNTVKAIGLLQQELKGLPRSRSGELSFGNLTEGGSRRAASSFFFELLVLGTRDCVKLSQNKAFSDIKIKGKERLWEGRAQDEAFAQ
ncbi:hypothetical protein M408DRAFT_328009 [Serendipita vermifera MAFF 305830]|uniref:Rad21/Rec8-like protein N-terminal domain-containing protein n=1 Tax=Serendipita vermifera MAFF 305830 TaxID=933852 RepID=A0A0C3B0U6_SERVB|nr:hypothetical protein M408DRAFT_328009 [Serendipita vermifera MAFF 305830]